MEPRLNFEKVQPQFTTTEIVELTLVITTRRAQNERMQAEGIPERSREPKFLGAKPSTRNIAVSRGLACLS
jgi:hypothetical protein